MSEFETCRMAPRRLRKHDSQLAWMDALVLDLKKRLLALEAEPITMQRLDEWAHKHRPELDRCTEPDRYY